MGISRNAMENLGCLPFCCVAEKVNPNESKQLQPDVKVTRDEPLPWPWAVNPQFS
jgi:hypothetical protein